MDYTYLGSEFTSATLLELDKIQDGVIALNLASSNIICINKSGTGPSAIFDISFDGSLSEPDLAALDAFVTAYTDAPIGTVVTIRDVRTPGTNAGTFAQDTWITRTLNTVIGSVPFMTLASNQFTLLAGNYLISISAPAYDVRNNQMKLVNVTASTFTLGSNAYSYNGVMSKSELSEYISLSVNTTFNIQHICAQTCENTGLGCATGFSVNEIYTCVLIQRMS